MPNALKLTVGVTAFHQHHQVAEEHLQNHHKQDEDGDAPCTGPQADQQSIGFINKSQQLEHPQDAAKFEHPQHHAAADLRHHEKQHGDQIDDAVKAADVAPWLRAQGHMQQVIDQKNDQAEAVDPNDSSTSLQLAAEAQRLWLEQQTHHAEQNRAKNDQVVEPAAWGVGFQHNPLQLPSA